MAQAKYKEYYQKMLEKDVELFDQFRAIHDKYEQDQKKFQEEFNQVGQKVVDAMHDWEKRLCSVMGRSQYSSYAQTLSEKFWDLARNDFPQIDMVGVKVE